MARKLPQGTKLIQIHAYEDNYPLNALLTEPVGGMGEEGPFVILAPATAVPAYFYVSFLSYLVGWFVSYLENGDWSY